ncbi:MAG: hypothetical protein NVS3B21_21580 [Acidimicrobiales bacterium]
MLAPVAAALVAISTPPALAAHQPVQPSQDWLTVAHRSGSRPVIVDGSGREVMLRGVNVVGVQDDYYGGAGTNPKPQYPIDPAAYAGTCPPMDHRSAEPPVCEVDAGQPEFSQSTAADSRNDFAQMRALGFNVVRLTISWSQLEPQPGAYSTTYIDRIAQVVGWASEQGVRVLLDMHQDNYSRYTPGSSAVPSSPLLSPTTPSANHAGGAPPWAVIADGVPAVAVGGQGPLNAYVAASFDSFWRNRIPSDEAGHAVPTGAAPGPGLQDHYIGAMAAVARRFSSEPTVVGYEIMNEPLSGTTPPGVFTTTQLLPFYRRVIDALTGVKDGVPCPTGLPATPVCGYPDLGVHVRHQSFFFEPMAIRNLTDAPDQAPAPFSTYPNLVYAPHAYTHVFTADTNVPGSRPKTSPYPTSYDQAYIVADREARSFGAALFVGEFGNSASDDDTLLAGSTAAADRAVSGESMWDWKSQCGVRTPTKDCQNAWSVYAGDPSPAPAQNGPIIPTRERYLSRAFPMATAGHLDLLTYDPQRHHLSMRATATRPATRPSAQTVVFLPATMTGNVTVSGGAVLANVTQEPDGTYRAFVAPAGSGPYSVDAS